MALSCVIFDCDGVILESVDAKTAAFTRVCEEIAPADALMVGDSKVDRDAALIVGARFYGRGAYFKNSGCPWGEDLRLLHDHIAKIRQE